MAGLSAPSFASVGYCHMFNFKSRSGTFTRPLLSVDGKTCVSVEAADETTYYADQVVLATGAWRPSLVDLEGQRVSKVSTCNLFGGDGLVDCSSLTI